MCGGTQVESLSTDGIDLDSTAVVQGTVTRDGAPAAGVYVRLLDETGEFTAEVVTSATGAYRFFARPGDWTLRVLAPGGATGEIAATAALGRVEERAITL
jgi:hypothetical protein